MKERIFISSVQKEFESERKALAQFLREDALLGSFFVPYLFEEVAASTHSPGKVYLSEVSAADIYIGILGAEYGFEDADGISPTEREYDCAKEEHVSRWIYIRGGNEVTRHPKQSAFINKVGEDVSRKRFSDLNDLLKEVYRTCVLHLKQTGKITSNDFDSSLHEFATIDNIDDSLISNFVQDAIAKRGLKLKPTAKKREVLTHLNLIREDRIVNSALLVFSIKPQAYFPSATVKCAHFHGVEIHKPIPDFKEFNGSVFEMADDAIDFVLSKISLSTGDRSQGNKVETIYEVPRAAIAEAIINAIAHRDYWSKGSVQVSVFSDRIEISNPGKLPDELDLKDLKVSHSSYPHNPLLANCMFLTGAIERFGTGTLDIFNLTEEQGLKTPVFSSDGSFKVILWRPSAIAGQATVQDTVQVPVQDTVQVFTNLSAIERVVWVLEGEMKRDEIQAALELKHRDNFRDVYLNPALKEGLVEMTIPDKATSSKQMYRLTKKGKKLKMKLKL